MKFNALGLAVVAVAMVAVPAIAHHSFAMFDASKTMTLEGTVKEFHWTNPHSWIFVNVPDAKGEATWAIEMGLPTGLMHKGCQPNTLPPEKKKKVRLPPLKDEKMGGQFVAETPPDGKKLGDPSTASPAPATNP